MRTFKIYVQLAFLITIILSCENNKEIDTETPQISLSQNDAFPINCDTLYFGEPFQLKVLFTDNIELGSFSIDIHNNFDQHSHSTEVTQCTFEPKKEPKNPFLYIEEFEITEGNTQYKTNQTISIPSYYNDILYDEGDYHFFISVTDKEGWSAQKGLSIKIMYRK